MRWNFSNQIIFNKVGKIKFELLFRVMYIFLHPIQTTSDETTSL